MRLSTYTSSALESHQNSGLLGAYRLVSFAGVCSSLQLSSLRVQPDHASLWDTGLRWSAIRTVYGLSSGTGSSFQNKALRRTLFRLATKVGFSFACRRGAGFRSTSGVVGLSFRSIFGFSRQLFKSSRALTRGLLDNSTVSFYRQGASYVRLSKSRARTWIDLRNRNFSLARQTKDISNTLRDQLLHNTRFRTVAWWSQTFYASRKSSVQSAIANSVRTLVPTKGSSFHTTHYIRNFFRTAVMVRGLGTRYAKRINLNDNNPRVFTKTRGSFGFSKGLSESRLRQFPNYWRKTRRVVPFKSQRSDWVFRETGYNFSGSQALKTFATGSTFDGSVAHLVFMLNGNSTIDFRSINNEIIAPNYSRINRTVQRFRSSMKRVLNRDVVRQMPYQLMRHCRQLIWSGFRGRPWLRYKRADVKSRVMYRRMQHVFTGYAPRFRYSKLNKLYMVRQRIGIRHNQFHRRALFFRLRRKWATSFGLNRGTGLFVSAMDGAARVIYNTLGKPTTSLLGAANYLLNPLHGKQDRYKTTGNRVASAAKRIRLRALATSCIQSQGADRPLEGLMVSGFAYDVAFKRNIVQETLANAPYQISLLHAAENNRYIMAARGLPGPALYSSVRGSSSRSIGGSTWQKCRPTMYRRRLGFVDKFLAYAIIRGGSSSTQRFAPEIINKNANAVSGPGVQLRVLDTSTLRGLRSMCREDFMSNVFNDEFPEDFPKLAEKRISDSVCEEVTLSFTKPSNLTQRKSAMERHSRWRKDTLKNIRSRADFVKRPKLTYRVTPFSYSSVVYSNLQKRVAGVPTAFDSTKSLFWKAATSRMSEVLDEAYEEIRVTALALGQDKDYNSFFSSDFTIPAIRSNLLELTNNSFSGTKHAKSIRFDKYRTNSQASFSPRISYTSAAVSSVGGLALWGSSLTPEYVRSRGSFMANSSTKPFEFFLQGLRKQSELAIPTARWFYRSDITNLYKKAVSIKRFRDLSPTAKDLLTFKYLRGYTNPNIPKSYISSNKKFLSMFGSHVYTTNDYNIVRHFNAVHKIPAIVSVVNNSIALNLALGYSTEVANWSNNKVLPTEVNPLAIDVRRTSRIFRSRPQGSRKRFYNPSMSSMLSTVYAPTLSELVYSNTKPSETRNRSVADLVSGAVSHKATGRVLYSGPALFAARFAKILALRERFTNHSVIKARRIAARLCRKKRDDTIFAMRQRLARIADQSLVKSAHEKIQQTQSYYSYKLSELESRPASLPSKYSAWLKILHCRWWGLLRADYKEQILAARAAAKPFASAIAGSPHLMRLLATPTKAEPVKGAGVDGTSVKKISQLKAEVRARDRFFGYAITPEGLKQQRNRRYQRKVLRRRRSIFGKKSIRCTPEDIIIELPQSNSPQVTSSVVDEPVHGENSTISLIRALEQLRLRSGR